MKRLAITLLAAGALVAGCSSSIDTSNQVPPPTQPPTNASKIQHVVILFQENRSFNNLFMSFPGAETATMGKCKQYTNKQYHLTFCKDNQPVKLRAITLETTGIFEGGKDISHSHHDFENEFDSGHMDGFDKLTFGTVGGPGYPAGTYPYAYVDREEVAPYWQLAARYAIADHMFSTATTDSFVAHQQIVAGTTRLNAHEALTDTPSNRPWGCDAPSGTVTGVIFSNGRVNDFGGPFPCFTQYKTMADVLDPASVSWKYYVQSYNIFSPNGDFSGEVWNAFDAIKSVRYGSDWHNVTIPNSSIFRDIKNGALPQVSWVIPCIRNSDHPASGSNTGPAWVTSIVNAIGKSQFWNSTAVIVMWDDWGGFYDPVPPPQLDYTSLGMRVPMLVISPYAKRHDVSKTRYEFGSVLKFIEQNFGTSSLGSTDVRANSISDIFNFSQPPTHFVPIGSTTAPSCTPPPSGSSIGSKVPNEDLDD